MVAAMSAVIRAARRLGLVRRESIPDSAGRPMQSIAPHSPLPIGDSVALSLDAVYRSVQILQTAVSQLSLDVWRGADQIDAPSWIATPDPWTTPQEFLEKTTASLALRGNAFWRVDRDSTGKIYGLRVLDPLDVNVTVTTSGIPLYRIGGDTFTRRDCAHLALMRRPGVRYPLGLGPIQAAKNQILSAVELRKYADGWMNGGSIPNGVLTSDQILTSDQAAALKTRFMESVRADEPIVLGQGTDYRPLMLKPEEVQWIETQKLNTVSVARIFGIPSRLIMIAPDGGTETYSNQQQEELSFIRWTLMSYLREIESTVTWLLPRGNTARFNLDAILRPDTRTRYEAHKIAIEAGFLTVDEVRAIEGLAPLQGADNAH